MFAGMLRNRKGSRAHESHGVHDAARPTIYIGRPPKLALVPRNKARCSDVIILQKNVVFLQSGQRI